MEKRFLRFTASITLLFAVFLCSCKKDIDTIGLNLQDGTLGNAYTEIPLTAYSTLEDSLFTKNLLYTLLGVSEPPAPVSAPSSPYRAAIPPWVTTLPSTLASLPCNTAATTATRSPNCALKFTNFPNSSQKPNTTAATIIPRITA